MNKILVVITGTQSPEAVFNVAINIAKANASYLYAVFMQRSDRSALSDYPFPNDLRLTEENMTGEDAAEEDLRIKRSYVQLLRDECREAGVSCNSNDEEVSWKQLIEHSTFADLMITGGRMEDEFPYNLLAADLQCPLLLVPPTSEPVKKVILCYDGSFSSIRAIKLYSYLFSQWRHLTVYLVMVQSAAGESLPYEPYLKSWLPVHFDKINIQVLVGDAEEQLTDFVYENAEQALVVLGAYGRSGLSRLLHQSMADVLLKKTRACLFITHQ